MNKEKQYFLINEVDLTQYNTLHINAKAYQMLFPYTNKGVEQIYSEYNGKKIIIIGKGSNILFSKQYYDENYVFLSFKLMDNIYIINSEIVCQSGVTLSRLSWFALENNISGYEFLEDIPGTVGGALIMNAGTYNHTISELVQKVEYFDIEYQKINIKKKGKNDFYNRNSVFNLNKNIILSANFKIERGNYLEVLDNLMKIKKGRYEKQPRNFPNAGSVFKKPKDINGELLEVWQLVENLGLRGTKKNGAMISDKHTGFIVNTGEATYSDIIFLINLIIIETKKKYGLTLELEWKKI